MRSILIYLCLLSEEFYFVREFLHRYIFDIIENFDKPLIFMSHLYPIYIYITKFSGLSKSSSIFSISDVGHGFLVCNFLIMFGG